MPILATTPPRMRVISKDHYAKFLQLTLALIRTYGDFDPYTFWYIYISIHIHFDTYTFRSIYISTHTHQTYLWLCCQFININIRTASSFSIMKPTWCTFHSIYWESRGLYMFRALLAHPQEVLHKQHLVYYVRIMSVGCNTVAVSVSWLNTHTI
jgi:hypothetical protein